MDSSKKPPPKKSKSGSAKEKRAKRYRSSCPAKLYERIQRAATQRLYLVDQQPLISSEEEEEEVGVKFTVLGSTGNVYEVRLGLVPTCNCPDFGKHKDLCKHILFVLLKVIGLSIDNPLAYQRAYLSTELQELLELLQNRRVGGSSSSSSSIMANARVRAAVAGTSPIAATEQDDNDNNEVHRRRSLEEDSDCPICFDKMTASTSSSIATTTSTLTYCRAACGANFHKDCIRHWLSQSSSSSSPSSSRVCPMCRQPWVEEEEKEEVAASARGRQSSSNEEGYENYGRLQGLSPDRDTSTYYGFSPYKRRRYGR